MSVLKQGFLQALRESGPIGHEAAKWIDRQKDQIDSLNVSLGKKQILINDLERKERDWERERTRLNQLIAKLKSKGEEV